MLSERLNSKCYVKYNYILYIHVYSVYLRSERYPSRTIPTSFPLKCCLILSTFRNDCSKAAREREKREREGREREGREREGREKG